jgi:hypothetical protein
VGGRRYLGEVFLGNSSLNSQVEAEARLLMVNCSEKPALLQVNHARGAYGSPRSHTPAKQQLLDRRCA